MAANPTGTNRATDAEAKAAAARKAKASVKEAIGKLIGDDAARATGAAEQRAAAAPGSGAEPTAAVSDTAASARGRTPPPR